MRRILVVSVNWMGDTIFSVPVFNALRALPGTETLAVLAPPRVCDVLALCPAVDTIIPYDETGAHRSWPARMTVARTLARSRFDTCLLLRPSFSRTLLCVLAGIPERVGFSTKNIPGLLTRIVKDDDLDRRHRADQYAALLERLNIPVQDRVCRLQVPAEIRYEARQWLARRGISAEKSFVVLNTGGNWDLKQWPEISFINLAAGLRRRNWNVLLTGAAPDQPRVARIAAAAGEGTFPAAGETPVPLLAAIFQEARAVVSADSGPLHLASAVGAVTIGIYGPTRPEITGPRGPGKGAVLFHEIACNRAPCYYLECPDNRCITTIGVDDVLSAL